MTLRKLRVESGKTVAEVATALGVTIRAIYNYEHGFRQINLEQILILSKFYAVNAEEIITAQLNSGRFDQ